MNKKCTKCLLYKEYSLFSKDSKASDNLQSWCKSCKLDSLLIYYKNYPHKKSKISKEYALQRYYRNKINYNISRRIRKFFKGNHTGWSLDAILGYSLEEFKQHIKSQFDSKMNWDNHGVYWEIDHIIPIYSFSIKDYDDIDFKKCWNLKNLRPLEKSINQSKGKKIL